jgi:hypothetical protein
MKKFHLGVGLVVLLTLGGAAPARHVTHPVTPQNRDKQFFAFAVAVKDVEGLKEVRVIVHNQAGQRPPAGSASGWVEVRRAKAEAPTITRIQAAGGQTYTFRLTPADLEGATFVFTEAPRDVRVPFPSPGDYWTFNLSDFVTTPKQ